MTNFNTLGKEFLSIRRTLMSVVSRIIPPKDVEDIVQEVYLKACQSKTKIEQPRSFMMAIAKNLALDYLKSSRVRLSTNLDDEQEHLDAMAARDGDNIFRAVVSDKEFARFCEITCSLPTQTRKAFILKKIFGYSQREIAEKMSISEKTVEKHVALGLFRCRQIMRPQKESIALKESTEGHT